MSDENAIRDELRAEGRSLVELIALMMAAGGLIGSFTSVVILHPFVPEVWSVWGLVIGAGAVLFLAGTFIIAYRLMEGRLIDMYCDTGGDNERGETA